MSERCVECAVSLVNGSDVTSDEVEAMVGLHRDAFPGFFLTSLGPRFLWLLYRGFVDSDSGICIIAADKGDLVGFAVGTTEPGSFFKRLLKKRGLAFALAAVPGLLHRPVFAARKCFGALFYRGEEPTAFPNAGLLSSLAVSPQAAGNGVGQQLVLAFCDELIERGVDAVYLTTDTSGNDPVNRFYEKCGFRLIDSFERPGNRKMNRWAKILTAPCNKR